MAADADGPVSPFYIPATAAGSPVSPHVLKYGDCFAVLDRFGNAQAIGPAAEGLFFEDTRYLSQLVLTVDGVRPLLLSSSVNEDNVVLAADLTNPDLVEGGVLRFAKDTVHILSTTLLGEDALFVQWELRNFGSAPTDFRLSIRFDADFVDMFEVRGTLRRERGRRLADEATGDGMILGYAGLDRVVRRTRLVFEPPPDITEARQVSWQVTLAPGAVQAVRWTVRCERDGRSSEAVSRTATLATLARWRADRGMRTADIYSSNETFNDVLSRSRADLDMLLTATEHGLYPYAGIPWFSTPFGRDGLITALECLWLDPAVAAGTLRFLAAHQANSYDPQSDAEPGKILHETRKGEMAMLGEVPFRQYYGSVDATPLFVVLAAAYYERTGDLDLVRAIWPNIEAALHWMTVHGDIAGSGFIDYDRKSVNGLVNQGWKDSFDAIFHADGRLASGPVALVEVQAYAYAAYRGAAVLARALDRAPRASALEEQAAALEERFAAAFWLEELGTFALALDGAREPCRVRTSNAGHVLLGGLATPEQAARVAAGLMGPASFSEWGIRTVAEGEARYNPMSYHNGSVWPHDNGLIAMGLARYGLKYPLVRLLTGLFDAALFMDLRRLPELFCGFTRRPGAGPTSYPVACIPQAWSAASVIAMLGALLGISFDLGARRIAFLRPMLPPWLDTLKLTNLRLGSAAVDVLLERRDDDVALHKLRREGEIEIVLTT